MEAPCMAKVTSGIIGSVDMWACDAYGVLYLQRFNATAMSEKSDARRSSTMPHY